MVELNPFYAPFMITFSVLLKEYPMMVTSEDLKVVE
jgi:hypothetical protein